MVTFIQVVARYVFNAGWPAALEFTRILFAWLVLFGMPLRDAGSARISASTC